MGLSLKRVLCVCRSFSAISCLVNGYAWLVNVAVHTSSQNGVPKSSSKTEQAYVTRSGCVSRVSDILIILTCVFYGKVCSNNAYCDDSNHSLVQSGKTSLCVFLWNGNRLLCGSAWSAFARRFLVLHFDMSVFKGTAVWEIFLYILRAVSCTAYAFTWKQATAGRCFWCKQQCVFASISGGVFWLQFWDNFLAPWAAKSGDVFGSHFFDFVVPAFWHSQKSGDGFR